ncbi:unnamed protein product, partial [marine sediment metagenome]
MRLQVVLSHSGCASRRRCAEFIKSGKVRVNGKVITEPGFKIEPSKDKIAYCGREISFKEKVYILLNKP